MDYTSTYFQKLHQKLNWDFFYSSGLASILAEQIFLSTSYVCVIIQGHLIRSMKCLFVLLVTLLGTFSSFSLKFPTNPAHNF